MNSIRKHLCYFIWYPVYSWSILINYELFIWGALPHEYGITDDQEKGLGGLFVQLENSCVARKGACWVLKFILLGDHQILAGRRESVEKGEVKGNAICLILAFQGANRPPIWGSLCSLWEKTCDDWELGRAWAWPWCFGALASQPCSGGSDMTEAFKMAFGVEDGGGWGSPRNWTCLAGMILLQLVGTEFSRNSILTIS